ncbi:SMP-30/gluconolactonase/LRE family protein [uncultured Methylobacterium sp.]|uniref:SMP-30/gluconolactonase/LRE family protein n=1 Tax=uncultured Methylobacterium sp. TaxID=157278 RepID=UPI0035C98871
MPHPHRRAVLGAGLGLMAAATARADALVVRVDDARLETLIDPAAELRTLVRDGRWCEGPCWAPALGGLVFSDTKANRIRVLAADGAVRTFRDPADNSNGNALDGQGRLVTCEHRTRRVVRREPDGALTVLADSYGGRPLNSPNDAVLGPDGAIWFTDPVFGITQPEEGILAEPAQAARRVYRIAAPGAVQAMTEAVDQPNGLAFAPDGRRLYVSDSGAALNPEGARAILAFPVAADGALGPPATFAEIEAGVPDGLKVDAAGRVYAACVDGVRIFLPDGTRLGRIATPTAAANLAFGGSDGRRLFITAAGNVHAFDLRG